MKIVLYCFQVDANIIRDDEEQNSTNILNDVGKHDNVEFQNATEENKDTDREGRLFFNRRPVRVRPLPPVNPAAALLIPAIPTLVGVSR